MQLPPEKMENKTPVSREPDQAPAEIGRLYTVREKGPFPFNHFFKVEVTKKPQAQHPA